MPDERNDSEERDGSDLGPADRTPPPLVPPPVRQDDEDADAVAARAVSDAPRDGGPLFVEPVATSAGTPHSVEHDGRPAPDAGDEVDGPVGRDLIEDRPHDPVEPGERRLDPAPQSLAASPIPTVDPPLLTETERGSDPGRDPDRVGPTPDGNADVAALAARDEQAAEAETVAVPHPSTSPSAPPQPLMVPPADGGVQQTAAYPQAAPPLPQRQFVQPPVPPKKKGNRGVGSLIAVLSVILFAALYLALAAFVLALITPAEGFGETIGRFVMTSIFWVPAILFVIAFVIVVLLANRAGWWAYVLGSLLVGAIVYFGTIGIQLLVEGVFAMTPDEAQDQFVRYALNPFVIVAGLVAREVALWTGSAIAARGRRMKARNVAARDDFERASAAHRAEYERVGY